MDPHSTSSTPPPPASTADLRFGEVLSLGTRVLQLQPEAIDEARGPRVDLWQAMLIVGIGGALTGLPGGLFTIVGAGAFALISHLLLCLVLHALAVAMGGHGDILEFTQGLGVATLVNWLGPIPLIGFLARLWFLVVLVPTLARAYGLPTEKALLVAIIPALMFFVGSVLLLVGAFSLGVLLG